MRALIGTLVLALAAGSAAAGDLSTKEMNRVKEAATVLQEIHAAPDKDVPQELWDKAECVIVVPGLKKAAFVIGGEYGKGLMSCRHDGEWGAPVSYAGRQRHLGPADRRSVDRPRAAGDEQERR